MKVTNNSVVISGPAGRIEALLDLPEVESRQQYFSVICHPHSLHGGTLTNKVVHTVSRSIAGLGLPSIRFNFRGVGNSEGNYDEGQGEQQDLKAVVDWMQARYPSRQLILGGFSFGAFVSAFASLQLRPEFLVSVAPPVKRFDFDGFVRPECDWLVIIGDQDELVEFDAVTGWIDSFDQPPALINMQGASHFFHGRLVELRQHIESSVRAFIE